MLAKLRSLAKRLDSLPAVRNARVKGRFRFLLPSFNLLLKLKTRNPVGFNEKVEYKMARDRRPLLTVFADKLEAKKYVERVLGPGYVPEVLAVADRAADLPWDELPEEVALKVNHGCGGTVVVFDDADSQGRIPDATIDNAWRNFFIRPDKADPDRIADYLDLCLRLNYYPVFGEWCYRNVRPRAFAEEFVPLPKDGASEGFRFYVFSGRCEAILLIGGITSSGTRRADFFLPDWTVLEGRRGAYLNHEITPSKPEELQEMVHIAEALGGETDFVRVDLIASSGRALVGELTNYPSAGRVLLQPSELEETMGAFWPMPVDYSTLFKGSYPLPDGDPAS